LGALSYWVSKLDAGATRGAITGAIMASEEYRTARIEMFYQDYLGRSVDSAALTYWLNYFASGGTENDFKAALLASPEYRAQFGTDNSFIAALYQDILGRSAEPNGVTYWADVMNAFSDGRAV